MERLPALFTTSQIAVIVDSTLAGWYLRANQSVTRLKGKKTDAIILCIAFALLVPYS